MRSVRVLLLAALGLTAAGMVNAPDRRPGAEVAAAGHETAATAEVAAAAPLPVPDHIRRALEGEDARLRRGVVVLRLASALVLAAVLAGGVASAAGLIPSPFALLP
jgi:hypothetical protein